MRILVADDEIELCALVRRALERDGHVVDVACNVSDAYEKALATSYDAIVLDLVMPDGSGFGVIKHLRAQGCWTPIVIISGLLTDVDDRVRALDEGADDFVTKPFSAAELAARLRAVVRRSGQERPTILEVGGISLDPATRRVLRNGIEVTLSRREFVLLEYFMRNPEYVLPRRGILTAVWGLDSSAGSNVVDVYVHYLRDKIDRPFGVTTIESVRGVGYRFLREPRDDAAQTIAWQHGDAAS